MSASHSRIRALTLWLLLTTCALSGCNQPEVLGGTPAVDPRRSAPMAHFADLHLEPILLSSHADYDRWEEEVSARGGAQLVYVLYREAMLRQRGDQRTFVRWILSALDPELDEQYRRGLQPFVQSLMNAPELGPDARYLFGQLAWYQLRQDPLGADAPRSALQGSLVETVEQNWRQVIAEAPMWRGPKGVTAADLQTRLNALALSVSPPSNEPLSAETDSTFSAQIIRQIEAAYKDAERPPPWRDKVEESQKVLTSFYQEYEDHGPKRACQRVDQALALVQDPTAIGDAYAHCALDRKNPFSALDQVRRMVHAKRVGGLNLVLDRLAQRARHNSALSEELDRLVGQLKSAVASDPAYGDSTGLTIWLQQASSD